MTYELRQYQKDAVDAALRCFRTEVNGILVLPTGSGKSLIIASITQKLEGKTIILQPSKEILEQNNAKIEAFGFHFSEIGIYSASCGPRHRGNVTLATIGSVIRCKKLFQGFDRVIIDECHLVNSDGGMYEDFINKLELPVIGLTATPYRMASGQVPSSEFLTNTRPRIFEQIIHVTQLSELYENGYLSYAKCDYENSYDSNEIKSNSTGIDFDDKSLHAYNQSQDIVDKVVSKARFQSKICDVNHILIFTKFTDEADIVAEELSKHNISCVSVSAKTKKKDRENILSKFKSGRIRCVVNVGVLTTGFDFPELDCIILGRPTKSVALYYQMVGRGIRPAQGKAYCRLVDLCDNVRRFGQIETFQIYNSNGRWQLRSNVGNLTGVNITTRGA